MTRGLWALAAALALSGCGPSNLLSGSLSELFPLDVSRVEVYRNDDALQVTYLRNQGVFLDVVIRVSIYVRDRELKPGAKFTLAGEYDVGHPRTTVAHAPGGEPLRLLPRVKRGDLHIASGGPAGQPISGDFSMLFESEGGDLGQGRTLNGGFSGMAIDAGFGPLN